jgi:hypothetical protein
MDWLFGNANVIVWSCTVKKNVYAMLDEVLKGASFKTSDIQVLSQVDTTMSKHVRESNPDKKYMLKELSRVAEKEGHTDISYILLIDDSPEKNLLNSRYNSIHPRTWLDDT